jgi:hypothetical protein
VKSERQLPKQEPRCVVTLLLQRFAYRTVELTVRVQKKTAYRFERSCDLKAKAEQRSESNYMGMFELDKRTVLLHSPREVSRIYEWGFVEPVVNMMKDSEGGKKKMIVADGLPEKRSRLR